MQRGPSIDGFREPEVGDFDDGRVVVRQEDVLRFEIAVSDSESMHVLHSSWSANNEVLCRERYGVQRARRRSGM